MAEPSTAQPFLNVCIAHVWIAHCMCAGKLIVHTSACCNFQTIAREWSNEPLNFDNIGDAMVSLFITMTLNGYAQIMDATMASPQDKGMQVRSTLRSIGYVAHGNSGQDQSTSLFRWPWVKVHMLTSSLEPSHSRGRGMALLPLCCNESCHSCCGTMEPFATRAAADCALVLF